MCSSGNKCLCCSTIYREPDWTPIRSIQRKRKHAGILIYPHENFKSPTPAKASPSSTKRRMVLGHGLRDGLSHRGFTPDTPALLQPVLPVEPEPGDNGTADV